MLDTRRGTLKKTRPRAPDSVAPEVSHDPQSYSQVQKGFPNGASRPASSPDSALISTVGLRLTNRVRTNRPTFSLFLDVCHSACRYHEQRSEHHSHQHSCL